ncbi:hypothetical protein FACS189421_08880 [Bacteroidia bacterium]|nr:hypothetical protein FACS189421_08880 [Bacteroidia bacterium]
MNTNVKLEKWQAAQKRHRLSDKHVQMARELGLNPDKLGKIDNHKQETWKSPLPQFIEEIYFKRFKKTEPATVKSIKEQVADEKAKKERQKKAKEQNRKEKAKIQENKPLADDCKESVTLSQLGFIIKKIHPRYKPHRYGCKTLRAIYEKLDRYEIVQTEETATVICRKQDGF